MVPRSAEWDRVVPEKKVPKSAEWEPEQPRTACDAEECRVGPSSAGRRRGRHWGAFKLRYY